MVGGSVGSFSAFMAQAGRIVVCGDAEDALGDSLYEAVIYVRGKVRSLGADARFEPMADTDRATVKSLLAQSGLHHDAAISSAWPRPGVCITGTPMPIRSIDMTGPQLEESAGFDRSTMDYIQACRGQRPV